MILASAIILKQPVKEDEFWHALSPGGEVWPDIQHHRSRGSGDDVDASLPVRPEMKRGGRVEISHVRVWCDL